MAFKRYKCNIDLSKQEKVDILSKYISYYEDLMENQGIEKLNVKIPRDYFDNLLDRIGALLNDEAHRLSENKNPVMDFLNDNPLPNCMKGMFDDEFRIFSLMLNSLKQWVSAETAATDKYFLGGTARATCRSAVKKCIITKEILGNNAELHHPMRDGRPPILLSKNGHNMVEHGKQENDSDDEWEKIKLIKKEKHSSWTLLREGCNAKISGGSSYRANAVSFANTIIKETGKTPLDIIQVLDSKGV